MESFAAEFVARQIACGLLSNLAVFTQKTFFLDFTLIKWLSERHRRIKNPRWKLAKRRNGTKPLAVGWPKVVGVVDASRLDPKVVKDVPKDEHRSRAVGFPRVTVPLTTSSRTVGQWPGNDWHNEPEERGVGCQPYLGPRDVLPVGPQSGSGSSLSRLDPQVDREVHQASLYENKV